MKRLVFAASFLIAAALTTPAYGGLIGASVDILADYPTLGTVYVDGGTYTVDGTVEWAEGAFSGYSDTLSVQITDTQIILSFNGSGADFAAASFNGLDIDALTGSITSAVTDGASVFDPVGITLSGNNLYLNYEGVSVAAADGQLSIIDYAGTGAGATPEPATYGLMAVGLLTLAFLRRRRAA